MKKLITTTAIGLMLALPAHAETKTGTTAKADVQASAQMSGDMFLRAIPHSINASGLIGKRVYVSKTAMDPGKPIKASDQSWDDIGEVSDVVLGIDGSVDAVLVDVGGFLGIGEKTVAISMNSLRLIPDGQTENAYFVVVTGSKDMLDQAPAYEGNLQTSWADTSETIAERAENTAMAAMEKARDSMGNAADATNQAATDAAQKTKDMATEAARETKQAAADTGQAVKNAAGDAGQATKEAANKAGSAIDNAVDSTAAAVGTAGQANARTGTRVDIATVDPDALRGEGVYGPNDDKVGDVSSLVQGSDGKVEGVVIDVGGFLGIGAKPVAIKAGDLTVLKDDHSITVHTGLTEEQLKALPKYQD